MIYEFRTYDIKPGSLAEVEKRFGEAYEFRKTLSPLAAFWHTEIGPLNQIIHVWPYKDLEERAKVRAAAYKSGQWPPKTGEFLTAQRSDIPDHGHDGDDRVELSTAAHAANPGPSASAAAATPTPTVAASATALPGLDVTA